MANPYQPGPGPMPAAPPPGYGWPAQPGSPVGQPYSPYSTPRAASSRNVPALCAAGLVLLSLLIEIGHLFAADGTEWLTSGAVVGWILMAAVTITGGVQTLTNRNPVAARISVAVAVGAVGMDPIFIVTNFFSGDRYYYGLKYHLNWLAIPGALTAIAALVLLYVASRADAKKLGGGGQTAAPQQAQPGWPQQQVPFGQQPPGGVHGQQAAGFPQQQPSQPGGFPQQQPGSPAGGFAQQQPSQPGGFPQQQQPFAPHSGGFQQPGFPPQGFPGQQHPGYAPDQPAQPGPGMQQPAAFGAPPQPPQQPNPSASPQDSGSQPTVLHQPGAYPPPQQPGSNPGGPFSPPSNPSDADSPPSGADPTIYQPPSNPPGPR